MFFGTRRGPGACCNGLERLDAAKPFSCARRTRAACQWLKDADSKQLRSSEFTFDFLCFFAAGSSSSGERCLLSEGWALLAVLLLAHHHCTQLPHSSPVAAYPARTLRRLAGTFDKSGAGCTRHCCCWRASCKTAVEHRHSATTHLAQPVRSGKACWCPLESSFTCKMRTMSFHFLSSADRSIASSLGHRVYILNRSTSLPAITGGFRKAYPPAPCMPAGLLQTVAVPAS